MSSRQINKTWHNILLIVCLFIYFVAAQAQHSSWINHNTRPDPHWQLFRETPSPYLAYSKYYPIPTAGALPPLPPLIQRQTATPEIVQRQRNEGNFYRVPTKPTTTPTAKNTTTLAPTKTSNNKRVFNKKCQKSRLPNRDAGYAAFEHKVIHVTKPTSAAKNRDYRKRRSFLPKATIKTALGLQQELRHQNGTEDSTTDGPTILQQQKHLHDIFMHYAGPQSVAFGHMEKQPGKLTQRFESLNKGNRYRGEVTWHDASTGGYGTQHWDLAQGSLKRSDHHNRPKEKH